METGKLPVGDGRAPRIMHAFAVLMAFIAIGCFSPSPPPGAYRCSAADSSCPSGQHCTCGLCVKTDDQAACSFRVRLPVLPTGQPHAYNEHEPFALTVTAIGTDNRTATANFNGTVTLSASWGDVVPSTLTIQGGSGTGMVSLNRETLDPQTATITATFGVNKGTSGKVSIHAQPFTRDATAVVPVPTPAAPFAFADTLVSQSDVVHNSSGWRLYFGGFSNNRKDYSFGVASGSDGKSFTPLSATPILSTGSADFTMKSIYSPSVFATSGGMFNMALQGNGNDIAPNMPAPSRIGIATSPDGTSAFTVANNGMPVLTERDCAYCSKEVQFPAVIPDPTTATPDGGAATSWIMFFNATQANGPVSIGRASSTDGVHFTAEPAPLLSGDVFGEAILLSPRVLLDGSVYKMWYSFAKLGDVNTTDFCLSKAGVGYATSSDGFYWIRSPSNPVMVGDTNGWDAGITAFLVGSVVPSDGQDAHNGITLYYSTFRQTTVTFKTGSVTTCLPNGIGRATRQ
jgi:hypothetical protein